MAHAYPITADLQLRVRTDKYYGFSFEETGGTTVGLIRVYEGTGATGTLLDSVRLAAGTSQTAWYGDEGIRCAQLFVDITGAVQGSIRAE